MHIVHISCSKNLEHTSIKTMSRIAFFFYSSGLSDMTGSVRPAIVCTCSLTTHPPEHPRLTTSVVSHSGVTRRLTSSIQEQQRLWTLETTRKLSRRTSIPKSELHLMTVSALHSQNSLHCFFFPVTEFLCPSLVKDTWICISQHCRQTIVNYTWTFL